ncbi:HD domain-containing protein [Streptococcus pluranimalium]|uniref:HD domain-containing protein n=1 Tax=Streptococcus hyovaginalis TaxID=149015 RepID=UPI0003FF9663|nr:HD domain-containing protein [Streptococcus hyovaginalis]MDY3024896.1 HD domain-containing protein [Streptococcus hyovaginalis]MDY4511010.1 HD domain-containing protein [Streptococcus hyovaginalis]MDY5974200.1 HD domain-containing protein [Streptococcus hyovaginalis]
MKKYENDAEFMALVGHLIDHPRFQKLDGIVQHHHSTRMEHSINVAYTSFKIARKFGWDKKSTARGGLLHDFFYYDWRVTKFNKSHAWVHPRIAIRNARKLTDLNKKEEDIILKHMWGATLAFPRYKESYIVTMVDKYWAVKEATIPMRRGLAKPIRYSRKFLGSHNR